ncbi:MAG: hypothetical protein M0R22_01530 [Dehalococcoidia bacterium]|jgi:hypothetical protein|nr:hypothetical protein [Dehalococcoidia bacterium]
MEEYPRVMYGHDSAGGPQCPSVDASGAVDVSATRVSGWKTATIDVSADDDLSDSVDLGEHYRYLAVIVPALTSARVGVHVAPSLAGTYVALGSGTSAQTDATSGGYATVFDIGGWRFVKLSTSAAQAADREFAVQGVRG